MAIRSRMQVKATVDQLFATLSPLLAAQPPYVAGLAGVDADRPSLFVGNHTIFGAIDIPALAHVLVRERDIYLRGLGDRRHFRVPLWRSILDSLGVVEGSRPNCDELMRMGEHIIVFPGGAREVMRRKGEKYQLLWQDRIGFAKMAIKNQYRIVPFSAVGADDWFDIKADAGDLERSPLGPLLKSLGLPIELAPPLAVGIAGTPFPKVQKFYFRFGIPIEASAYGNDPDDESACHALKHQVQKAVEEGIEDMLAMQKLDKAV